MGNKDRNLNVPYLRGGIPGALSVLMLISAILSIIAMAVLTVFGVIAMTKDFLSGLALLVMSVGMIPAIMIGFGARKVRRGNSAGADRIASGFAMQRVLLIISMIFSIISGLISIVNTAGRRSYYYSSSSVTGTIVGSLIGLGISVVLSVLMMKYYARMRTIAEYVRSEMDAGDGTAHDNFAYEAPVAMTVFITVISGIAAMLCLFFSSWLGRTLRSSYRNMISPLAFFVFLGAAQNCLLVVCLRGYRRSHTCMDREHHVLQPAGYVPVRALCVIGTILLSWLALSEVKEAIWFLGYYNLGSVALTRFVWVACYTVLAAALLVRKRPLLVLIGAGIAAVLQGISAANQLGRDVEILLSIETLAAFLFYAGLTVISLLELMKKRPPRALRFATWGLIVTSLLLTIFRLLSIGYIEYNLYRIIDYAVKGAACFSLCFAGDREEEESAEDIISGDEDVSPPDKESEGAVSLREASAE